MTTPFVVLPDVFPKYHTMDDAWSCGAACVQMVLGSSRPNGPALESQQVVMSVGNLQDQLRLLKSVVRSTSNDLVDWTGGPDGMETTLREYIGDTKLNYKRIYRNDNERVEAWIAGTLYQYRMPAIVLTGSSKGYSHWTLVYGCLLNSEPTGGGQTATGIQGFFIHNPMLPGFFIQNPNLPGYERQVGNHSQGDLCGKLDDEAVGQQIDRYHYVPIKEWRRHYTPRRIPTFEGPNFIALVFGKLGDERAPNFTGGSEPDTFQSAPKLVPREIEEDEAAAKAITNLDELGLFNVTPWKDAIGSNVTVAQLKANPAQYSIVHKVERLDQQFERTGTPSKPFVERARNPYYLVLIRTGRPAANNSGTTTDTSVANTDTRATAIAVAIDAVTGEFLETMAVPDPERNVLTVPNRDQLLAKLNASVPSPTPPTPPTPSPAPPATPSPVQILRFNKIVTAEGNRPTWRLVNVHVNSPSGSSGAGSSSTDTITTTSTEPARIEPHPEHPDLVWSPAIESTSRFYPFYWLLENRENRYVRIDTPMKAEPNVFTIMHFIGRLNFLPSFPRFERFDEVNLSRRFRKRR